MYNNHGHLMYELEKSMFIKKHNEIIDNLQIDDKLYDLTEYGEEYIMWTSQDFTEELLVQYELDKPIRLQRYCIRRNGDSYWEELDFQEKIYSNILKQNIIGYREALERIYEYDVMDLVKEACDCFVPGCRDGYAVIDLQNGEITGISLEDQTLLETQYCILYMIDKEMLDIYFEQLFESNEIENLQQSDKSIERWINENNIDWRSKLVDLIFHFFNQDVEEYELWERDVRSSLDNWYSNLYTQPEIAVK